MKARYVRALCAGVTVVVLAAMPLASRGAERVELPSPPEAGGAVGPSLRREADVAVARSLKYLAARQKGDGSWSNGDFPALTALPLWALAQSQQPDRKVLAKAVSYILSCVRSDGGIYKDVPGVKGGGLANYNTALCMVALHAVGDPGLAGAIQNARAFMARTQHFGNDMYYGGMGYDPDTGRPYADLSNTYIAYEAMRLTRTVEDLRTDAALRTDLNWDAATKFLERLQHRRESNDQPWASDKPEERGGFVYRPDASHAGTFEKEDGAVSFRSYGSMTYAGLLSLIYADVRRDDPRVQAAFDWAMRHWTLDENPGMGRQGLYFFYQVLAKALAAYGENPIVREGAAALNWRLEIARKLVSLQKIDPADGTGYWVNDEGRWWESDPVLVTSYAILALQAVSSGRP